MRLDDGYDTDLLGTFSRDVPRHGTQLEAARAKARIGKGPSGLPQGLASEGAFGPDPYAGLFPWNVEIVVFNLRPARAGGGGHGLGQGLLRAPAVRGLGGAGGNRRKRRILRQQLVLRPDGQGDPRLLKGIADWPALHSAHAQARQQSIGGLVFAETDGRAHANPSGMDMTHLAAKDLVRRLALPCPACFLPSYWLVERLPGLPCASCGLATRALKAEVHGCVKCGYCQTRPATGPE